MSDNPATVNGLEDAFATIKALTQSNESLNAEIHRLNAVVTESADSASRLLLTIEENRKTHEKTLKGIRKERDIAVVGLCMFARKIGWKVSRWSDRSPNVDPDYKTVVSIEAPVGQLTWHVHELQVPLLGWVPQTVDGWDGAKAAERDARLLSLKV